MKYPPGRIHTLPRRGLGAFLRFGQTRTGVLGLTSVANLVIRTGSSVILTRLLSPADFGTIGIITSVFVAVTMVTDLGFLDFLIRHERTDECHFQNVIWTIHVKRGLAVFAGVAAGSPLIAWLFGKPLIALPLAVASLTLAFNGLASLSLMTALRHDKARELSLLDLFLQLFQTGACVLLALWWRNAWSIIAAMVLQAGLRTLLSYRIFSDSSHGFARDQQISREFWAFSRFVMISSALTLVIGQSDKLVLGRAFSLGEFGLYAIAVTIASAPVAFADSYVNRILFPILSAAWRSNPGDIAGTYYRVRRLPAALYAFACGGLMGSANLAIAILYDPRYAVASTFLSLLMISTALRLPTGASAQLLVAVGQVKKTMHLTIVRLLWVVFTIPLGLAVFGPIGVVSAIGLTEVPALLYCWLSLRRLNVMNLREEAVFLGLAMAGAVAGWLVSMQVLTIFPRL